MCRLNEASSFGERLDAAQKKSKRSSKKKRKKSTAVSSKKKKRRNQRHPRWETKERWYDMEANEAALQLSGSLEKKLKKCMLLYDGQSVVTGFWCSRTDCHEHQRVQCLAPKVAIGSDFRVRS